jgi:putative tricarboxylic transport membrane protein
MESLGLIARGFSGAITPENLFFCFIGSVLGTLVGVLPGLGPTAGIALLIPIVASFPPTAGIIMLAAIYYGSMYGGSTTSILVNMPGEAASVVTCLDGYQLARQGRAGSALAIAAIGSFIAGTLGLLGLCFAAPILADFALEFGPTEYFALVVFAISVVINLFGKSVLKGLISAAIGFLFVIPGLDPLLGIPRLTFGLSQLYGGIDYISAIVGLFAISEVLRSTELSLVAICEKVGRLLPTREELRTCLGAILRSTVVGFFLGLIPGCTPAVTSFVAYDLEKRISKHPEKFGQGALEGVAAPESANNAITSSGFIPLFSLGIPATPALAVLLGGLMIYGLQPGPLLFKLHADFVWTVIASMYIGNVMLLVLNLPLVGLWARLAMIPYRFMAPGILVICFIGSYSVRNRIFDSWMAVLFGLLGYLLDKVEIPIFPLVMTLILGNILESSLGQMLTVSGGSFGILLDRPIALGLLMGTAVIIIYSLYAQHRRGPLNQEK